MTPKCVGCNVFYPMDVECRLFCPKKGKKLKKKRQHTHFEKQQTKHKENRLSQTGIGEPPFPTTLMAYDDGIRRM